MVDIENIRQLVDLMMANDLLEITLRQGEEEISLKRPGPAPAAGVLSGTVYPSHFAAHAVAPTESLPATVSVDDDLLRITSPMVGKYYACASPESPPFIKPGMEIHPDTVVCIIEAMKVFNEIKAELHGIVEKVYVTNEQAVEYGQPLFGVRRS